MGKDIDLDVLSTLVCGYMPNYREKEMNASIIRLLKAQLISPRRGYIVTLKGHKKLNK